MDAIKRKHGLKADEYWQRGQGPEDYQRLNKQYEVASEADFVSTLKEFGLSDLADLKQHDPGEFDRLLRTRTPICISQE